MAKTKSKIIAIIPARGGSKGLPRKNIRLLVGKPLISYTIEESLKSKYLDCVIVSTEDQEIAEISKKYGANVVKRPDELARDDSSTSDVIFHVLEYLEIQNEKQKIIVLLQPTCPLRNSKDIDNAIELFLQSECDSVISVCESKKFVNLASTIEDQYLKPIYESNYSKLKQQKFPKNYFFNGAIFVTTIRNFRENLGFYSSKTLPYIMPYSRSIDIDSEFDLLITEANLLWLNNCKHLDTFTKEI